MEVFRQTIKNLDVFSKHKILRNILILSLLSVVIYPTIYVRMIYPAMTRAIVKNIKSEVELMARDLALSLDLGRTALERGRLQGDLLSRVKDLEKDPSVIALKIYTTSGKTIYSSDPKDIGTINEEKEFSEVIAKGIVHSSLFQIKVKSSKGKTRTIKLMDTTVPIVKDNAFVGAFRLRYDLTERIRLLDTLVSRFSAFLFLVGIGLMGTIILMSFRMAEAEGALAQSQEELNKAKLYLESLIESSTDAIIATGINGEAVLFNKGAEVLSGYRREEVEVQGVPLVTESEEQGREVMRRMREGGGSVSALETTFRAKDGTNIPVLISASILYDEDGQEIGTVGFSKDLRERKKEEEQLIRAEKMASVGLLTAGVSHEVLNPLNIIMLRLHTMISDPATPPDITKHLRVLERHSNRIAKIARDLLSFARQRTPERRLISLNDLVKRTLVMVEEVLRSQKIAVDLRFAEDLPSVYVDQDQLQQVVLNLLTNAKDAMPEGGRLVIGTEVVQEDGNQFVRLRVEDTGEGIAPEHMEKLFDPFFTTKPEGKGTGLGLAICQGIVETHGGAIWAEAVPEGGVAFVVQLAVERGDDQQGLSG